MHREGAVLINPQRRDDGLSGYALPIGACNAVRIMPQQQTRVFTPLQDSNHA